MNFNLLSITLVCDPLVLSGVIMTSAEEHWEVWTTGRRPNVRDPQPSVFCFSIHLLISSIHQCTYTSIVRIAVIIFSRSRGHAPTHSIWMYYHCCACLSLSRSPDLVVFESIRPRVSFLTSCFPVTSLWRKRLCSL